MWIKMPVRSLDMPRIESRASRSCGLKFFMRTDKLLSLEVTSFTLVWIKIAISVQIGKSFSCHELHARVD